MKKLSVALLVMLLAVSFVFANGAKEEAAPASDVFHVGIVTGTVSQSEYDLRGAEALILI